MSKKKQYISFFVIIVLSALLTYVTSAFRFNVEGKDYIDTSSAIIKQKIEGTGEEKKVKVLYYRDKLLGVLQDEKKLNQMLDKKYKEEFAFSFPDSKLGLSIDLHFSDEFTINKFQNKDNEIMAFIDEKDLYSFETNKVTFSNGNVLYVKNINDYEKAKEEYVLKFVDKKSFSKLKANQKINFTKGYGRYIKKYGFVEKAEVGKGLADMNQILDSKEKVLEWMFKGYDDEKKEYVVEDGDTLQGVASKNGLALVQLMALNTDKVKEENQLLESGTSLNVKQINAQISLEVDKVAINKVAVYPETPLYIEDNTLAKGVELVVQEENVGYNKVVVNEVYLNGVLSENEEVSSKLIQSPQREIIRKGTQTDSDLVNGNEGILTNYRFKGAGNFRWPVDNPSVTCGWQCYRNHTAMDITNMYDRSGPLYAADSGVVITNSYNGINGYYIEIDHLNGFVTYYGHMRQPGLIEENTSVKRGQQIGIMGMTGVATGPHVHFEIRYHGEKMDPAMYLK